jgi:PAS domain S-box-containing protein
LNTNSDRHFPVESLSSIYSDFDNYFTWLLSYEDNADDINYSENVLKITGFEAAELRGMRGKWNKLIYEDDLEAVRLKFNELINSLSLNSYTVDYRIINRDNNIIWLRESVRAERTRAGKLKIVYGIVSNISDLKVAEEKLHDEILKLEEMNGSKDDFIAILSHDLRSPFTSILGFAEILVNEPNLPQSEKNEYLSLIQSSSKKQLKLVNNLLDWSRLRTGRVQPVLSKINSRNSVYNSISALTGEAVRKNIEIKVFIPESLYIEADDILFSKVILNLLENSIKYSGENKSIDVKTSQFNDKLVEFIVRDNGKGIPEPNKHKLFQINKIFSTQGTQGEKGTGLGLILCKEIVEHHGGDIWFFSEPDAGSEFHFTFPLFKENLLLIAIDKDTTGEIKKIMGEVKPSYVIRVCSNGFEAVDAIKHKLPSVIILNDKMQLMDGLKFAEILQSENRTAGIPVCLLADELKEEAVKRYNDLGINRILYKPYENTKLMSELQAL